MTERYQNRSYSTTHHASDGNPFEPDREESDPLAELARLIGQTDPFGPAGNTNGHVPPRAAARRGQHHEYQQDDPQEQEYPQAYEQEHRSSPEPEEPLASAGPPQWIQRANLRREAQREAPWESQHEPQTGVGNDDDLRHVRQRYAGQSHQARQDMYYQDEPAYAEPEPDPSRYDDALYGQPEQDLQREPAHPDDPYAYQGGYDQDETEEEGGRKRRGPMVLVVGILALAVIGTAAAYGYRTYFGAPRGDPPIIKADNSPTKIIPAPSDGNTKLPDRMVSGDGTEKIVPREEQPVDVGTRAAGPRAVFPSLSQNSNTAAASVPPGAAPQPVEGPAAAPYNGTLPNGEPRKIRTVPVPGDRPDAAAGTVNAPPPAPPAGAKSATAARAKAPGAQANAGTNEPLSLAPQAQQSAAPAETRVAATGPAAMAPAAGAGSGGYLVQVSSQRNEADAQASFRALQNKFPSVLGSQTPVIKRADIDGKGTYYRTMVGPFGTSEEAAQFCGNLKSAGGQCIVQRN